MRHRTANHDVRRVTNQRGRSSDIRGNDLREQERFGAEVQFLRDGERNRHHEQHRRHVVKKAGEYRRDETEINENTAWLRLGRLGGADGHEVKESGVRRNAHEHRQKGPAKKRIDGARIEQTPPKKICLCDCTHYNMTQGHLQAVILVFLLL